jgi:hypothetical protein
MKRNFEEDCGTAERSREMERTWRGYALDLLGTIGDVPRTEGLLGVGDVVLMTAPGWEHVIVTCEYRSRGR